MIVENGTGLPDADSYISLADANLYLTNRGYLSTSEEKLILATDFIDQAFRHDGDPLNPAQRLQHPKMFGGVSVRLKEATAMLAHLAGSTDLYADENEAPIMSETVGSISVSYDTDKFANEHRFRIVENMLSVIATFKKKGGAGFSYRRTSR